MQPIIILGAVVVAAALIGTGFLGQGGNIVLWVQSLGWGEADLTPPITHAFIDLNLKKIRNDAGTTGTDTDDYFDNVINSCSFHAAEDILANPPAVEGVKNLSTGVIICKLTNEKDLAIAEGRVLLDGSSEEGCPQSDLGKLRADPQKERAGGYHASDHLNIDICQFAYPGSNDVQKVTDVKIVVEGAFSTAMNQMN